MSDPLDHLLAPTLACHGRRHLLVDEDGRVAVLPLRPKVNEDEALLAVQMYLALGRGLLVIV